MKRIVIIHNSIHILFITLTVVQLFYFNSASLHFVGLHVNNAGCIHVFMFLKINQHMTWV